MVGKHSRRLGLQEGDTLRVQQVQQTANVLGSVINPTVLIYDPDPGDTILVPEDLERVAWLKTVKDVATIFGQLL